MTISPVNSVFTSQVQAAIYELMISLLQNLEQGSTNQSGLSANRGLAPVLANTSSSNSSTNAAAASSTSGSNICSTTGAAAQGSFADLVNQAAKRYNINPQLIDAVIKAESNFNPNAVSSCGAQGLMQLMPATARGLGVTNAMDPAQNINGGAKFLSGLLSRYGGNVRLAVAAYNAGPGAVDEYHGVPPYAETQTYVSRIMSYLQSSGSWKG
ncbi:MAG: lytic transglycosylase domain-containing protein [Anaerolineaceae bacterium]|nr:lytic transglycosylase domain-containing protein [Anaerolineaceae bacterium]